MASFRTSPWYRRRRARRKPGPWSPPAFTKAPREAKDERIYNASPEALIGLIRQTRDAHTLLVLGHNPGLHDLAVRLIASGDIDARERVNEKLPTSGLVVIDCRSTTGRGCTPMPAGRSVSSDPA